GGRIRTARIRLAGRLDDPATSGPALDAPSGWLAFDGLSVRFLDTMPEARAVAGQGAFSHAGWKLVVLDGDVAGVELRQARVAIATPENGPVRLSVRASVGGPLAATVALLDRPPVRLTK